MCSHHVCMGDIVGYNAFPSECIEVVRKLECPVVKGNHDEQASMLGDQEGFNPLAEEAHQLDARNSFRTTTRNGCRSLRLQRQVRDFTIVHATLDTPHKWGYVFNQPRCSRQLQLPAYLSLLHRPHPLSEGLCARRKW